MILEPTTNFNKDTFDKEEEEEEEEEEDETLLDACADAATTVDISERFLFFVILSSLMAGITFS